MYSWYHVVALYGFLLHGVATYLLGMSYVASLGATPFGHCLPECRVEAKGHPGSWWRIRRGRVHRHHSPFIVLEHTSRSDMSTMSLLWLV